jgi:integrase
VSVHKTPYGTWRVIWYEADGRQKSRTFKAKADASRFDREAKRKKEEGSPIRLLREAPKLGDFSAQWLAGKTDLAQPTLDSYIGCLERHVLPFLGDLRVHHSDIGDEVLAEWLLGRQRAGVGSAVLRRAHVVLRQILQAAVSPYRLLVRNPLADIPAPEAADPDHRHLTAEGVESLRKFFVGEGDLWSAGFISVLGYVGIRPQDALALRWLDIGEKLTDHHKNVDGQIMAGSKTGLHYRRTVDLPGPVLEDLNALRAAQGTSEGLGLVFPRKDGRPLRKSDYDNWRKRKFRAAVKATGVDVRRPYDLRHTCASLLAASGKNQLEIAQQLGNKPETVVKHYLHLIELEGGRRIPIDEQIRTARAEMGT